MTSRLTAVALLLGLALPFVSAQPAEAPAIDTKTFPFAKGNWDLSALDHDPVKLVMASYDRTFNQVQLVLEFTRDLTVRDIDWTGVRPEPPFRFNFEDKDGVTLLSLRGIYLGEPVMRKGRRVRVAVQFPIIPLPPEKPREADRERNYYLGLSKKVVVDYIPYGT